MDARAVSGCRETQRLASLWFNKSSEWRDRAATRTTRSSFAAFFSKQDQETAAQLYRADRRLRGLEA